MWAYCPECHVDLDLSELEEISCWRCGWTIPGAADPLHFMDLSPLHVSSRKEGNLG